MENRAKCCAERTADRLRPILTYRCSKRSEWRGTKLMKTLREEAFGKATVRLVQAPAGYAGIVIRDGVASKPLHGDDATALWLELIEDLDRSSVSYFGYDGARARFSRLFPEGFKGAPYRSHERDYKQKASDFLRATVPLEAAAEATSVECDLIAKVYAKTNLLAAVEQARTR